MRVNVVCRNYRDDRILPRFSRYLADGLGWALTVAPVAADVHYLMGYFEVQVCKDWPDGPVVSLFTHREEQPPGNDKAKLYDAIARRVQLRVAMCQLYARPLSAIGPTIQPPLPVERERFTIASRSKRPRPVAGFSGFTYSNRRKGEALALTAVRATRGRVDWVASGRGWPISGHRHAWAEMPRFYQQLDVLVCTSLVEGGPMPVLEALSCGVRVVIPQGVGILDELPDVAGIYRYPRGNALGLLAAVQAAAFPAKVPNREALRAVTEPFTVEAWCRAHVDGFQREFSQ